MTEREASRCRRQAARQYWKDSTSQRLLEFGPQVLSEIELIAVLIKGETREGAHELAAVLLAAFGSLRALLAAAPVETERLGLNAPSHAALQAALELTRRNYQALLVTGPALPSPRATRDYLQVKLRDLPHEVFCVIYLDNRNRVRHFAELFRGTIDGAAVHPREVVREALKHQAAAVIFAHNHPSGVAEPSARDEEITCRLKQALSLVDIRVIDHLVVGDGVVTSFSERGLL